MKPPSKRFNTSRLQEILVPIALVVLAVILISVIVLVVLTVVEAAPA